MKQLFIFLLIGLILGCSDTSPNLTVSGSITGLRKGTLYLERAQDTTISILDSMIIEGEPEFVLQARLSEPEVLFLRLDVGKEELQRLPFFADSGTTYIKTSLKRFIYDANIEGSQEQQLMNEFDEYFNRFNDQYLDLIKQQLEFASDSIKMAELTEQIEGLQRRKYLYAVNFALKNKDSRVAPFIALNKIPDANPKLLDTIYQSFENEVANSRYGVQLKEYLDKLEKPLN